AWCPERGRDWLRSYGSRRLLGQTCAPIAAFVAGFVGASRDAPAHTEGMVKVVALGDSLTAGFNLPASAAFPARLERALKAKGVAVEVANGGASGHTVSGGPAGLDWSVPEGTEAVILELGANDMLRGIDPRITRA